MSLRSNHPDAWLLKVLWVLGLSALSRYCPPVSPGERQEPGPNPRALPAEMLTLVKRTGESHLRYDYWEIAVMCRRTDVSVMDQQSYQVIRRYNLPRKLTVRAAP